MRKRILLALLISSGLYAQEVKAPPALKDSVIAHIRTLQLQISNGNVQILQIQQQQQVVSQQLNAATQSALKDSGLDEKKYVLDPNTLTVTEKPNAEGNKK